MTLETDKLLHALGDWGADIPAALQRMMDDADFYSRMLTEFAADPQLWKLSADLRKGDYNEAFQCAHSLKGAAASLELRPLYEVLGSICDMLRRPEKIDPAETARKTEVYIQRRDRYLEILKTV